jgi:outer membrane lipoprotein-sorting protein
MSLAKHGIAVLLALLAAGSGVGVADTAAPPVPNNAWAIVQRMSERNPSLESYRARVHVDIRMLNFPFLAPKLDGTSYYRRPDTYVVVFDRMPSYARGFQRLFDDIGNPKAWEKNENVTLAGTSWLRGRQTIVLRLTKKIHSDILDHTLAYVDPTDYALLQMEWYYTSGGKITMSQDYRVEGTYSVLGQQHATIDIPHVHAVADATYGTYQTNVPLELSGAGAR